MYPEILPPLLSDVPEEERRRVEPKKSLKQVYKDFTTIPIPLPVWLWNVIVILIYFQVIVFMLWGGLVVLAFIFTAVTGTW